MFNRLMRNKRGISVAISSVIMVAAVITVGLAVVAWTTSTFANEQQQSSEFFSSRGETIRESFVIENVWFYTGGVNVTVRNVGTVDMNLTSISFQQIGGASGKVWNQSRIIPKNDYATITISPWTWAPGGVYKVIAASLRGQQVTEYYSTIG